MRKRLLIAAAALPFAVAAVVAAPAAAQQAPAVAAPAETPPAAAPAEAAPIVAAQPGSLDEFNAWSDSFNRRFVDWVVAPAVSGWNSLPAPLPAMGRNALENMKEPVTTLSKAMASDAPGALYSAARFTINTTVGLLGVLDVANAVGMPAQPAAFAEGVCKAGVPVGPYIVLPLVGDTTLGVAGTGLVAMVGSTLALSVVSFQAAMASVAVDVVASAAALHNVQETAGQSIVRRKETYTDWLGGRGCRPT